MPTGELFDEAYILHDEITGVILPHHKYRLKRGDGSYEEGITDEHGQTHVVSAVASEEITVEVVEEL
jgi:type VI secretion system secreted protein VgrG